MSDQSKKTFLALLVGAFGGMAPSIIKLIPGLFQDIFPSSGSWLAISLLAGLGIVTVFVLEERNLRKAFVLGAGAPAMIASLTTATVGPTSATLTGLEIITPVYAQQYHPVQSVKLVIVQNESMHRTNDMWLRADSSTLAMYWTRGDTLLVDLPEGTETLWLNYPGDTEALTIRRSEFDSNGTVHIGIAGQPETKNFWQTFAGVRIPNYKIVKLGSRRP